MTTLTRSGCVVPEALDHCSYARSRAGIWRDVLRLGSISTSSSLLYASSFNLVSFQIIAFLRPARPRLCTDYHYRYRGLRPGDGNSLVGAGRVSCSPGLVTGYVTLRPCSSLPCAKFQPS